MSPHASELTTAQLLTRARAAVARGDHLGAIAAALVVIAEAQVGGADAGALHVCKICNHAKSSDGYFCATVGCTCTLSHRRTRQ